MGLVNSSAFWQRMVDVILGGLIGRSCHVYLDDVILTQSPLLKFSDFSRPFILMTDASGSALGAVLAQEFDDEEHPIAYASHKLNGAEKKYGATDQECLAFAWAVKHFRCYLFGKRFSVVTDCSSLRWLMNARDQNSRLARWNLLLQENDFEIVHRAGKMHPNADALSRAAVRTIGVSFGAL